jgi:hypothetical protein
MKSQLEEFVIMTKLMGQPTDLLGALGEAIATRNRVEDEETRGHVSFGPALRAADETLERVEEFVASFPARSIEDVSLHAMMALSRLIVYREQHGDDEKVGELDMTFKLLASVVDALAAAGVLRVPPDVRQHYFAPWQAPWLTPEEANRQWRIGCFKDEATARAHCLKIHGSENGGPFGRGWPA